MLVCLVPVLIPTTFVVTYLRETVFEPVDKIVTITVLIISIVHVHYLANDDVQTKITLSVACLIPQLYI